jgi:hypothetical protein
VRTLAGNYQLFKLAPWMLTSENRVLFELISHKVMRLIVPYLLILVLISASVLATGSKIFAAVAAIQIVCWMVALVSLRYPIPMLDRIAGPAAALLVLNVAAVVGLYKFLFTNGPLWKIWNSDKSAAMGANAGSYPTDV